MSLDRPSAFGGILLVAVVFAGAAATINWAMTAKPARTIIVTGVNGPGMAVNSDRFNCRVWGRLKVCASNDIRWRVEP